MERLFLMEDARCPKCNDPDFVDIYDFETVVCLNCGFETKRDYKNGKNEKDNNTNKSGTRLE